MWLSLLGSHSPVVLPLPGSCFGLGHTQQGLALTPGSVLTPSRVWGEPYKVSGMELRSTVYKTSFLPAVLLLQLLPHPFEGLVLTKACSPSTRGDTWKIAGSTVCVCDVERTDLMLSAHGGPRTRTPDPLLARQGLSAAGCSSWGNAQLVAFEKKKVPAAFPKLSSNDPLEHCSDGGYFIFLSPPSRPCSFLLQ